jgi:hypothetical protein
MSVSLDLSVGVSVDILDFKAEGLDVSDLLSVKSLGANEPGKPIRGQVTSGRVNLRNAVNDFDGQENNWHMDLQKVSSCYRPPEYAAKEQHAALWSSFALGSLGD